MEKDHASLKYQLDEQAKEVSSSKSALRSCEADKATLNAQLSRLRRQMEEASGKDDGNSGVVASTDGGALGSTGGRVPAQTTGYAAIFAADNLQIIEGIGPKIEKILKDSGIADWGRLAAATPANLKSTLEAAGPNYRIHDPGSWPKQAGMAKDGKWKELIEFQKQADGGKTTEGDGDTPSKVEKLFAKALGFSTSKPDDLKIIEGVGPKIEQLLKDGGIKNWKDLANASVDSIKAILEAAGDRYRLAKPDTWPKQAQYAADGNWAALKLTKTNLTAANKSNLSDIALL